MMKKFWVRHRAGHSDSLYELKFDVDKDIKYVGSVGFKGKKPFSKYLSLVSNVMGSPNEWAKEDQLDIKGQKAYHDGFYVNHIDDLYLENLENVLVENVLIHELCINDCQNIEFENIKFPFLEGRLFDVEEIRKEDYGFLRSKIKIKNAKSITINGYTSDCNSLEDFIELYKKSYSFKRPTN